MTSIATSHVAVRTPSRTPRSFASARATLRRPFRTFAAAAELERRRSIEDPIVLTALLRG